jgi:hypothetical protein
VDVDLDGTVRGLTEGVDQIGTWSFVLQQCGSICPGVPQFLKFPPAAPSYTRVSERSVGGRDQRQHRSRKAPTCKYSVGLMSVLIQRLWAEITRSESPGRAARRMQCHYSSSTTGPLTQGLAPISTGNCQREREGEGEEEEEDKGGTNSD